MSRWMALGMGFVMVLGSMTLGCPQSTPVSPGADGDLGGCPCDAHQTSADRTSGDLNQPQEMLPETSADLSVPPTIVVSPTSLDFIRVFSYSPEEKTITISNNGSSSLVVDRFVLSGTPVFTVIIEGQEFPLSADTMEGIFLSPPLVIAPSIEASILVRFSPTYGDPAKALLSLYSNDPSQPEGLGVEIFGNYRLGCLRMEADEVQFGGTKLGTQATKPLDLATCWNTEVPLEIYGLRMKSGDGLSSDFGIDFSTLDHLPSRDDPLIILPDAVVPLTLTYAPVAASPKEVDGSLVFDQGTLLIESNSYEGVDEVPLLGAGVDFDCPVAVIENSGFNDVPPQTVVHLVGSKSFSPAGAITKWEWSVVQPSGSTSVFVPSYNFPDPVFEGNVAGIYMFSLDVWDSTGNKSCLPATYELLVCGCDNNIHVELLWKTPGDPDEGDTGPGAGTDLNLHLAHPLASQPDRDGDGLPDPWFDDLYDCYFGNTSPNWGGIDSTLPDDPGLDRDDTDGGGPENINLELDYPENITYRVGVDFWLDNGFGPALATVRVYVYGVCVFEIKDVLMAEKDMWDVCTIEWPSGKVTPALTPEGTNKITPNYVTDDLLM